MSGDRFERRCKTHPRREVVEIARPRRGNTSTFMVCEHGHRVDNWLVVDTETRAVVGAASILGGLLVVPALAPSAGPVGPCKNGHTGRWRRRSDKPGKAGWICGACHYQSQRRYLDRRATA